MPHKLQSQIENKQQSIVTLGQEVTQCNLKIKNLEADIKTHNTNLCKQLTLLSAEMSKLKDEISFKDKKLSTLESTLQ